MKPVISTIYPLNAMKNDLTGVEYEEKRGEYRLHGENPDI